jgi:hypothetical protein
MTRTERTHFELAAAYPIISEAADAGVEIMGFNTQDTYCDGGFLTSAPEVMEYIIDNHPHDSETYKAALQYQARFETIGDSPAGDGQDREEWEEEREVADDDFWNDLSKIYMKKIKAAIDSAIQK